MPTTFTPGRLIVDETSNFGAAILPSTVQVDQPDRARWQAAMLRWLNLINGSRVGNVLLQNLDARRGTAAVDIRLTTYPRTDAQQDEAWTNGPMAPGGHNTTGARAIFVSYTPPDARQRPISLDPMKHPAPVLVHELLHVLMGAHGLNDMTDANGVQRPIVTWNAAGVYPSWKEFLATTVQNMFLSERGVVLRDGYTDGGDDPWIDSQQTSPAAATPVGMRAIGPGVDLARYVSAYRPPLEFLRNGLPTFTQQLAALTTVPFNPFRQMTQQPPAGGPRPTGAPAGASRVPQRI